MRTFIALPISEDTKNLLGNIENTLKHIPLNAKWVKPENLHITLKFIGEIGEEKIEEIKGIIKEIGGSFSKLKVSLKEFGFFPTKSNPKVFFISTDKEEILGEIADRLEDKMERLGIKKEHRFRSHITLARLKSRRNIDQLQREIRDLKLTHSFSINSIVLFKSTLTKFGPIYEEIFKIYLRN